MDLYLEKAVEETAKAKALVYAMDQTFVGRPYGTLTKEDIDMAISLFYLLEDIVDKIGDALDNEP